MMTKSWKIHFLKKFVVKNSAGQKHRSPIKNLVEKPGIKNII